MPLLNVDQAAKHLNITVRHVRLLVYQRRIPYVKLGRLVRFDVADLDRWVQARKVDPVDDLIYRTRLARGLPAAADDPATVRRIRRIVQPYPQVSSPQPRSATGRVRPERLAD